MRIRISDLLNAFSDKIKILSLDCFDTLIWRLTATPEDVFYNLAQRPLFRKRGITARERYKAEESARNKMYVQYGNSEVTLKQIYELSFTSLNEKEINELCEEEISAEIETSYVFPSVIELIQNAHSHGLKIIVVSNTYFKEKQLRKLLSSVMPNDVYKLIDNVFCSCEFKVSKAQGLYQRIVETLAVPAESILHMGDHFLLDLEFPKLVGIQALQLIQHNELIAEILRLQAVAALIGIPDIRRSRALASPYKGIYGLTNIPTENPENIVGYISLGQIIYPFARFILEEIEELKREGKKVKVLFVMRDSFLVASACDVLAEKKVGTLLQCSRFTSFAPSFYNKDDIVNYLSGNLNDWRIQDHCRQFHFTEEMINEILDAVKNAANPDKEFCDIILQKKYTDYIIEKSAEFRSRLVKYLKKETDIKSGDTVVFVDVGYQGTTQRLLTQILTDELKVKEVTGRYLVLLDLPEWQNTKRGLIDASWCDAQSLNLLNRDIYIIEELCSSGGNSVINYDEDGNPQYLISSLNPEQRNKIGLVQNACLGFVRDAKEFFSNLSIPMQMLKDIAFSELVRSIFLRTINENSYLSSFENEANKFTNIKMPIFQNAGVDTNIVRRTGLWLEKRSALSLRRDVDIQDMLTIMLRRKFNFQLLRSDFSLRREIIQVELSQGEELSKGYFPAVPTHDGFFALTFTLTIQAEIQRIRIKLCFGQVFEWMQIESAELIDANWFLNEREIQHSESVRDNLLFNEMEEKSKNLFHCKAYDSSILLDVTPSQNNSVFRIAFRPIARRSNL